MVLDSWQHAAVKRIKSSIANGGVNILTMIAKGYHATADRFFDDDLFSLRAFIRALSV